jgi:hypothetical protein
MNCLTADRKWIHYVWRKYLEPRASRSDTAISFSYIWIGTHQGANCVEGDTLHTMNAVQAPGRNRRPMT